MLVRFLVVKDGGTWLAEECVIRQHCELATWRRSTSFLLARKLGRRRRICPRRRVYLGLRAKREIYGFPPALRLPPSPCLPARLIWDPHTNLHECTLISVNLCMKVG